MKNQVLKAAIVLVCVGAQACIYVSSDGDSDGLSGEVVTRTSRPADFDQVAVSGAFEKVTVEICDCEPLVKVRGDERLVEEVTIRTDDGVLELGHRRQFVVTDDRLNVVVQTPALNGLTLTSSAEVEAGPIDTTVFEMISSGSGDATLSGRVEVLELTVSGSGEVLAYDLEAQTVQLTSSGSGDSEVCATSFLDGRITGSGDLFYDCAPADVDIDTTGSGDISIR